MVETYDTGNNFTLILAVFKVAIYKPTYKQGCINFFTSLDRDLETLTFPLSLYEPPSEAKEQTAGGFGGAVSPQTRLRF